MRNNYMYNTQQTDYTSRLDSSYGADNLGSLPINWNNITSAFHAFVGCAGLGDITINSNSLQNIEIAFHSSGINSIILNTPNLSNARYAFAFSTIKTFTILDSSKIQDMNGMFFSCTLLECDLTGLSLAGLTTNNLDKFMTGTSLNNQNYNRILAYWDANKTSYPFADITIHMGTSKSDSTSGGINGAIAKLNLVKYGWTIIDRDGTIT